MLNSETDLIESYPSVCNVIRSCTTVEQLDTAKQYVELYFKQLPIEVVTVFRDDIQKLIEYQTLAINVNGE